MNPSDFWSHYEVSINGYVELHEKILFISDVASKAKRTLVWRGQKDAAWALHSKLYRNYLDQKPSSITELSFSKLEREILTDLRRWGLHSQKNIGRLSVLSQLAMLQHFGSPTRLLDVTFNALVGAFFATEDDPKYESEDARLFAIDVTDRLINENKNLRNWEDSLDTPWSDSFISQQYQNRQIYGTNDKIKLLESFFKSSWLHEWSSHFYAWRPPALDARIAAQNGGFIFGGIVGPTLREGYVDSSKEERSSGFQLNNPEKENSKLTINDTRKITCLAIQPQPFPTGSIRKNTKNSVYSIRISSSEKKSIREKLKQIFGYSHSTIYPDFSGFSLFGEGNLTKIKS